MLVNMVGFNLAWLGLVMFGNSFTVLAILMVVIHLSKLTALKHETYLVVVVTIVGCLIDSTLHLLNFYIFIDSITIPFWLVVLWACFACTLCHSLSFLSRSKKLQMMVGGGLAPLSYISAEKLGAVDFAYSTVISYLVLAVIWAGLLVLFFSLNKHLIKKEEKHV